MFGPPSQGKRSGTVLYSWQYLDHGRNFGTTARFAPRPLPNGDVAQYIASKFQGAAVWPCRGEVILNRSAATVAPFTRDGLVEAIGSDRCRLVEGSWSWAGLASALGRFDADMEVVGPDELRDAFARLAHRFATAAGDHE